MHGKNIFTNVLKFTIETRKFIKSIQFSLENYKKHSIDRKAYILSNNLDLSIVNTKTSFISKIQSPPNVMIEFTKPF